MTRFTRSDDVGEDQRTRQWRVSPALVIHSPDALRGRTFALDLPQSVVGREPTSDVVLEDEYVSRRHAVIRRDGGAVTIEDLRSSAGTRVNGRQITAPTELYDGDHVEFGPCDLELRGGAERPSPRSGTGVRYEVAGQQGGVINNVGGNQLNQLAVRIAPMRRRARILLRTGVAALLGSLVVGGLMMILVGREIVDALETLYRTQSPEQAERAFRDISFAPFALAPIATVLGIAGICLVVSSLLTRRRIRKEEERHDR